MRTWATRFRVFLKCEHAGCEKRAIYVVNWALPVKSSRNQWGVTGWREYAGLFCSRHAVLKNDTYSRARLPKVMRLHVLKDGQS